MAASNLSERKDGWLIKQKQKRFFVCEGGVLRWMAHPQSSDINGSLDLRDYFVELRDKGGKKAEIVLTPRERGGSTAFKGKKKQKDKKYILGDKNANNVAGWYEHLERVVKAQQLGPAVPADVPLPTHEAGDIDSRPPSSAPPSAPEEAQPPPCPSKMGWLVKKGKMRFFVLRNAILYWFSNEVPPGSDLIRLQPNGSVDLFDCDIRAGPPMQQPKHSTPFNVTFQEKGSKEIYIVTSKTDEDAREWVTVLTAAAGWAAGQISTLRDVVEGISPSAVNMRGNMTKKGDVRYFELKNQHLGWWDSERNSNGRTAPPNGRIKLLNAEVGPDPQKRHAIVIVNTLARFRYVLQCEHRMQFEQWLLGLRRAAEAVTSVMGDAPLSAAVLRSISTMSVDMCGVSISTDSMLPEGTTAVEAPADPGRRELGGWMTKKGKRRFFVLRDSGMCRCTLFKERRWS
jgi:PH domain